MVLGGVLGQLTVAGYSFKASTGFCCASVLLILKTSIIKKSRYDPLERLLGPSVLATLLKIALQV